MGNYFLDRQYIVYKRSIAIFIYFLAVRQQCLFRVKLTNYTNQNMNPSPSTDWKTTRQRECNFKTRDPGVLVGSGSVLSGSGMNIKIQNPFKIQLFLQVILTKILLKHWYHNYFDFYIGILLKRNPQIKN